MKNLHVLLQIKGTHKKVQENKSIISYTYNLQMIDGIKIYFQENKNKNEKD